MGISDILLRNYLLYLYSFCYNFLQGKKVNFNHLLLSSNPQEEKLLEYGFKRFKKKLVLEKSLDAVFYAVVSFDWENMWAEVFEKETDEKYVLLDVKTANGAFVNGVRQKVLDLLKDIQEKCFVCVDLKSLYLDWLETDFGVKGDFPWEDEASVFRCKNKKWFALIMKIKYKNLGFDSEEPVWVVNLKMDVEKIPQLVNRKSIFPAWHMNKKYWITVVLSAATDFNQLKELTLRSWQLVSGN